MQFRFHLQAIDVNSFSFEMEKNNKFFLVSSHEFFVSSIMGKLFI